MRHLFKGEKKTRKHKSRLLTLEKGSSWNNRESLVISTLRKLNIFSNDETANFPRQSWLYFPFLQAHTFFLITGSCSSRSQDYSQLVLFVAPRQRLIFEFEKHRHFPREKLLKISIFRVNIRKECWTNCCDRTKLHKEGFGQLHWIFTEEGMLQQRAYGKLGGNSDTTFSRAIGYA